MRIWLCLGRVLGDLLEVPYPVTNSDLHHLQCSDSCLMTTFVPGVAAACNCETMTSFPRRNPRGFPALRTAFTNSLASRLQVDSTWPMSDVLWKTVLMNDSVRAWGFVFLRSSWMNMCVIFALFMFRKLILECACEVFTVVCWMPLNERRMARWLPAVPWWFCWLGHIASTVYGHMKCIFFSAWSSLRNRSKLARVSCAHTSVQLCRRCACCSSKLALLRGQATSNKKYQRLARSLFTTSLCDCSSPCNLPQFLMLTEAVCAIVMLSSFSNIEMGSSSKTVENHSAITYAGVQTAHLKWVALKWSLGLFSVYAFARAFVRALDAA